MEYSAWHSVIQDGNGAVVPMAKITVRSTSTGALAKLYSARDGSAPKANPFNADENGQVFFFVAGGAYTIKAEFGTQERTWPFVPVGTAAEYDIDSLALYLNSGVVYFQKYAELGTYVPLSYPAAAVVLADPDALKNGYYTNSGTGWVFGRALQDTISRLFITGGAVNTPTANVGQGINPSAPLVFYVDVTAPNTASVTLNVVGLGQGVVLNAAGNPLAAGEWLGRVMLTREADGRYRIMNDPASALSAAQSATASDTARAASVTAKNQSESAKDQSVTAKNQSEAAKGVSETARDQSVTAKNQSEAARDQSVTAKNQAVAASDSSGQSAVAAAISENNAASSASAASGSASSASTSKNQAASSATTSTNEADRSKREADRAEAAAGGLINAVQFVPQTLTVPQQTQARNNIGAQVAGSYATADQGLKADGAVRFDAAQTLTRAQKGLASANMGAGIMSGFRNKLINGDFSVKNRAQAVAVAVPAGQTIYATDRWEFKNTTNQPCNVTCYGSTGSANTNGLGNVEYCYVAFAATPTSGKLEISQKIEYAGTLSRKSATLRVHTTARDPEDAYTAYLVQNFGVSLGPGNIPSPDVVINGTVDKALVPDANPTVGPYYRYNHLFEIPSINGKTFSQIIYDKGHLRATISITPRTVAAFHLALISLVEGDARADPDPFAKRPEALELILCQRYYEKSYDPHVLPGTMTEYGRIYGSVSGSGVLRSQASYKASKRDQPTIVVYSTLTGASAKLEVAAADLSPERVTTSRTAFDLAATGVTANTYFSYQWVADAEIY